MKVKHVKMPILMIVIGMIVAVASCFLTGIVKEPVIKEHDFEYSVTYALDGEVRTFDGVFKCSFSGYDRFDDPTYRHYVGEYTQNGKALDSFSFTVAQKDGVELSIITILDAAYLMGDPDKYAYESGNEDPYLEAIDSEGMAVEVSEFFDVEIISWEYPTPVENSFEFVGFSLLHTVSMLAMLLVGLLTMIVCILFVKKHRRVRYNLPDRLSVILNLMIVFWGLPFMTVCIGLFPLTMSGESLLYQIFLCIPAITAFTVAASVAFRRKGFTKFGLLVQLVGPALFVGLIFVDTIMNNLFF